jgi:hypothetical protein
MGGFLLVNNVPSHIPFSQELFILADRQLLFVGTYLGTESVAAGC